MGNVGYKYSDWYIPEKYANLKEEILTNKTFNIDVNEYDKVLFKANEYLENSDIIKAMKCNNGNLVNMHYDDTINKDSAITLQHLVSILLFNDYKKLAMNFCKGMIKKNKNENDNDLKERVKEYRNWYKSIRETVELFGDKLSDSKMNIYYASISNADNIIFDQFAASFN